MAPSEATPNGRKPVDDPLVDRIAALSECVDPVPESVKDAAKALFQARRARSESAPAQQVDPTRDKEAAKSSTRS